MKRLNVIIFSRDRACQLDLLLRSILEFVEGREQIRFSILYKASSSDYELGYEMLKDMFPMFHFVDEQDSFLDFKIQTMVLIDRSIPLLMFLVDDDLFKNSFSLDDPPVRAFENDRRIMCLSLRLGQHIKHCYPVDQPVPTPDFQSEYVWEWKGKPGDWGYPMSLDGNIYHTAKMLPLLKYISFQNPSALESVLASDPPDIPLMNCYPESRILNLPVNKVQRVFDNRSGNLDPAELNDAFVNRNQRICLAPFRHISNQSPHQVYPLEFSEEG
jgi:hypothetical protein